MDMNEGRQTYTIQIHDEGDGMLWGEIVDLEGCFASGKDMDQLMEAAAEAITLYLADEAPAEDEADVVSFRHAHRRRRRRQPTIPDFEPTQATIALEA